MKLWNAAAVAVTAFLFTGAAANAADIVNETPQPPEAVIIEPVANWSGVYIGVAGGGFWADANSTGQDFPDTESIDFDESGFAASIYGGYNWQVQSFVFGLEGEVNWLDLDFGADRFQTTGPWTYLSADWSATVSARAGYLFTPEVLAYGKLGYTWTNFEAGSWGGNPAIDDGVVGAVQVGAGIEAMLTSNLILRGEVAYNFAVDDVSIDYGGDDNYVYEPDYGTAKIGIAYKF